MNIDLSQEEIQLILRYLPPDGHAEKLSKKLIHYVFPEIDQETIAHKWQDWVNKMR
jgi:hypothetical protein